MSPDALGHHLAVVEYQDKTPWWVGDEAWARDDPHLAPLELLRVASWKSGQGLGWLSLNPPGFIEQRTAEVMVHLKPWVGQDLVGNADSRVWDDWLEAAWNAIGQKQGPGLMGVRGVGFPQATAVLCILNPRVWPVIDRWAVKTIFGPHDEGSLKPRIWQRGVAYQSYAKCLANQWAANFPPGLSIHDLDVEAMRAMQTDRCGKRLGSLPPGWRAIEPPP